MFNEGQSRLSDAMAAVEGARAREVSVVVADDHPLFLGALKWTVQSCGSLTLLAGATDGLQALEIIGLNPPKSPFWTCGCPSSTGARSCAAR